MYLPKHFATDDLAWLDELVRRDPFATLVSTHDGEPFATHLPVTCRRAGREVRVLGHWARPNPQWRTVAGQTALCIVHGPHAYVSPGFYPDPASRVPTWNYAVAHLYGRVRLVDRPDELLALVSELSDRQEAGREHPWSLASAQPSLRDMVAGIVGFELEATRVEIKLKLNQHHPIENVEGAARALSAGAGEDERSIGGWMAEQAARRRAAG